MEERDFDIIVVGCGCAGGIAAYVAARSGKSVLIVERGEIAGAKNMTGGRLYAHSLRSVLDAYGEGEVSWESIPFERKITHERIALVDTSSALAVDFSSDRLGEAPCDSYSVLRAEFDPWLMGLCEEAGCEIVAGIAVEELLKDNDGTIVGVRAGEDEITSQVVILAEGQNSLLAERSLGVRRPLSHEMAVGIKQVFELPAHVIEDRFLCPEGEGAAMLFVGDCTHGNVGGGFLYTNRESVSLGLVATISDMSESETTIYQALEDFKEHPTVAPIIRGARLVEHSGHMVAEGGYDSVPKLVYPGALVAGDAAMLCMNLGYMVRGMDLAIASGRYAAEAACSSIDRGDVTEEGLASYRVKLEESFVIKDLRTFRQWPHVMESWGRLFSEYPAMVADVFNEMFLVDGTPMEPLRKRILPPVKRRGYFKLAREMKGALKSL